MTEKDTNMNSVFEDGIKETENRNCSILPGYYKGYCAGQESVLNRVCQWLKKNAKEYIDYYYQEDLTDNLINDLTKHIKEL